MDRVLRTLMISLCLTAGLPGVTWAQSWTDAGKEIRIYQLLILDSQLGNPYDEVRDALTKALETHGYSADKNLKITLQVIGNDVKTGEDILRQELGRRRYDVVFVGGTVATIAAKNVLYGNKRQAVVFAAPTDPVGIGVIKDFTSKPAANFTGICYPVPIKARFRFIRQLMPQARTFGLIYADMPQSHSYIRWLQDLIELDPEFKQFKIILRKVALVTGEQGDQQMAAAAEKHVKAIDASVDAFIKPVDQMGTRRSFSEVVYKTASKPLIGMVKDDVMAHWGATAVVYPSHVSIGKQAARMIRDLFQGKQVTEILPEWPKEYGFAVDLAKARQFGINIPVEILQMAGENIVK
ncbi:MAG: hypothetical protein HY847_12745 [Betaproteobacteria bacterium]|nr:hypothetical protein [Betaproteobacteria bacterium]